MDAEFLHIPRDCQSFLPPRDRSVCFEVNPPSGAVCLQVSRSRSSGRRCLSPGLEQVEEPYSPPVTLLLRVVKKIQEDKATALVIAPNWSNQPWYPLLAQMLVECPLCLPTSRSLLYLPFDQQAHHPLWASLNLTVWPVSGDVSKQRAFRQRLSRSYCRRGVSLPERDILARGGLGRTGVPCVDGVPFQHL